MKLRLLLADSAQVGESNKVSALGIGWTRTITPTPPLAVIVLIDMDSREAGKKHQLVIELCDQDGKPVVLAGGSDGVPESGVRIGAEITGDAAPDLVEGESLRLAAAVQLGPGIPLSPGVYRFQVWAENHADSLVYEQFRIISQA